MRLYLIALQFLTIIPLPSLRCGERDLGRSMALFPLVGMTLGFIMVGCNAVLVPFLPRPVTDLLLIALLAFLTGGLHLDGLADVCDGLAARGGRERFLEVMKDSRIGAVGAVGLIIGILLKYQALLHVPAIEERTALLLFPTVARTAQVVMTVGAKRARTEGLGAAFIGGAGACHLATAILALFVAAYLLLGWHGVGLSAILLAFAGICRVYFQHRLGGITGDVIGCVSELMEICCLLLFLAMNRTT